MKRTYITGQAEAGGGKIPLVSTNTDTGDILSMIMVRSGIGRGAHTVKPGLYGAGSPDSSSPVFVSANYKYSFDILRAALKNIDAWILVLDTKGVNVWCAAGKGTFGTGELVKRIRDERLHDIVSHRQLIVPQLGAAGVAAHSVREATGFKVVYGPVRAADIPAFLAAGLKASLQMRRVRFSFRDRLILVPMEIVTWFRYIAAAAALFVVISAFGRDGLSYGRAAAAGARAVLFLLLAYISGAVTGPLMLPWLPGRSFSVKGFWASVIMMSLFYPLLTGTGGLMEMTAWMLIVPAVSAFITMNFTGASTYTSPGGVMKEMRMAVPAQLAGFACGTLLYFISRFV